MGSLGAGGAPEPFPSPLPTLMPQWYPTLGQVSSHPLNTHLGAAANSGPTTEDLLVCTCPLPWTPRPVAIRVDQSPRVSLGGGTQRSQEPRSTPDSFPWEEMLR